MKRVGHARMATTNLYVGAMHDADQRALDAIAAVKSRYAG